MRLINEAHSQRARPKNGIKVTLSLGSAGIFTLILASSYVFFGSQIKTGPLPSLYSSSATLTIKSPQSLEDAINSATGTLFAGESIRRYGEERFFGSNFVPQNRTISPHALPPIITCDKWNVVTTIFAPSEAVKRAAKVLGWCTVIVADTKTPQDYMEQAGLAGMESTVHYLSVQDQQVWLEKENTKGGGISAVGKFLNAIPYKHFARKNIGYLYAIQHGAKLLFDFDDDNLLPINPNTGEVYPPLTNERQLKNASIVLTGPTAFNHHPLMGATVNNSWARGFPLQYIQDIPTQGQIAYDNVDLDLLESVAVMQFCANGNPDIDAIHRLVHPLPMTFESSSSADGDPGNRPVSTEGSLVVPSHAFAPYNAQATVHTYKALWALLLPFTVPGRVSDIWRGYFAEALFRDLGLSVTFLPPAIVQDRNEHHYLADMQAELDLYFKSGKLLEFLGGWDSPADSIPERMESLWIDLYERGYIELNDVKVVQLWLAALVEINYKFPSMQRRRIDHTVLMGQFNIPSSLRDVLFWQQKWREWFNRIVIRGPFSEDQIQDMSRHNIKAFQGRDDAGWHSPMENLMLTLQDSKSIEGVTGVVYIHDDALLNLTNIPMGMIPNSVIASHDVSDPRMGLENEERRRHVALTSFRVHKDGSFFSKVDGFNTTDRGALFNSMSYWCWFENCIRTFSTIANDTRGDKYREGPDQYILVPPAISGGSDFLYVSTSLADVYQEAAQLMVEHGVFLECGFPKIIDILRQHGNATIQSVNLCTHFHYDRGTVRMIAECPDRNPMGVIHPFKIGQHGYQNWTHVFDWMVTGDASKLGTLPIGAP